MTDRLINIREAAEILGIHPDSVRNLIRRSYIKETRILGRVLVAQSEIERVMREGAGDGRKRRVQPDAAPDREHALAGR